MASLGNKGQSHVLKPEDNAAFGRIEIRLVTRLCGQRGCFSLRGAPERDSSISVLVVLVAPTAFQNTHGSKAWQAHGSGLSLLPSVVAASMLILLLVPRNEGTFTQCGDKGYVSFALCPLSGYLGRRETSKDNEEGQEEAETPLEQKEKLQIGEKGETAKGKKQPRGWSFLLNGPVKLSCRFLCSSWEPALFPLLASCAHSSRLTRIIPPHLSKSVQDLPSLITAPGTECSPEKLFCLTALLHGVGQCDVGLSSPVDHEELRRLLYQLQCQ